MGPIDYEALARKHGGTQAAPAGDLSAVAARHGGQPIQVQVVEPPGLLDRFGAGFWKQSNPVTILQGLAQAAGHPIDTAKGILDAQGQLAVKAGEAFQRGDYVTGLRHSLEYLLPVLGPAMSPIGDRAAAGDVAGASGEAVAMGAMQALPGSPIVKQGVTPRISSALNAVEQAAVRFADRRGIPIPASVRTGNRVAQNLEGLAQNSLGGAGYAKRQINATDDALQRTGDDLAQQVHPNAVTPEQAGQNVVGTLKGDIRRLDQLADVEYNELRSIERDPRNSRNVPIKQLQVPDPNNPGKMIWQPLYGDVPLPVDMRPVKTALEPVYQRYMRAMPIAEARASKGLKAIDNILNEDDFKAASVADMDLGAIKEAARTEMPELRDVSQGLAAAAVKELEQAVQAAVAQAHVPGYSPTSGAVNPALAHLLKGRQHTVSKFDTADVLKTFAHDMEPEPVAVYNGLIWAKDAGIQRLREVAAKAPQQMGEIGRAFVQGLLDVAGQSGDMGKARQVLNSWTNLGPETKKVLFRNPGLISDLDNFFQLAKKVTSNPNPSGSGYMANLTATGLLLISEPAVGGAYVIGNAALARLLYNPQIAKALANGMQVRLGTPAATAALGQILSAVGPDAQPVGRDREPQITK